MSTKKTAYVLEPDIRLDRTWKIEEEKFDLRRHHHQENIFTLSNGNLATRGSLEYALHLGDPGTYLAGLFGPTPIHFEEIVNLPSWLAIHISAAQSPLDLEDGKILEFRKTLDMKNGIFRHVLRWQDDQGRITRYESARLVHYARMDLGILWGAITPENWSGSLVLRSGIYGNVWNTTMIHPLKVQHVNPSRMEAKEHTGVCWTGEAQGTGIQLALAVKTKLSMEGERDLVHSRFSIAESWNVKMRQGQTLRFEKFASVQSSRTVANPKSAAQKSVAAAAEAGLSALLEEHIAAWSERWDCSDVRIDGDASAQQAMRFNLFHLNQLGNAKDDNVSIAAKGLHGEGYRGHVFWDTEIYMLPFYIYTWPEAARNLLSYRLHRLPAARENAKRENLRGAKFPWESADKGRDVTPHLAGNIVTGENVQPYATEERQHHVTADVAFGFTHYVLATGDEKFYRDGASRVLIETAMFWADRCEWDDNRKKYVIRDVMPPDEFHNHVDNSVYTNFLASWNLTQGLHAVEYLRQCDPARLMEFERELGLSEEDYKDWRKKSSRFLILYDPETFLYEQHEGYHNLESVELKKDSLGKPIIPGDLWARMYRTQVIKQADVVLLMYILPDKFTRPVKKANYDYYLPRTSHCSSLSPGICAIVGIEVGEYESAYQAFLLGARMELEKSSHYPDGIHAANLGNTWQVAVNGFGGLRVLEGHLHFNPWLPPDWKRLGFKIQWQGECLDIEITQETLKARRPKTKRREPMRIFVFEDFVDVTEEGVSINLKEARRTQPSKDNQ